MRVGVDGVVCGRGSVGGEGGTKEAWWAIGRGDNTLGGDCGGVVIGGRDGRIFRERESDVCLAHLVHDGIVGGYGSSALNTRGR